jgi:hypothetical protein
MGATVWLEVDDGAATNSPDNSLLLRLEAELAALAGRLSVRPLASFYAYGGLAAEAAAEFADDLAAAGIEPAPVPDDWFDANDGLASFAALLGEVRAHPESLSFKPRRGQDHWLSDLVEELAYCEGRLQQAASSGQGFRLQIVP